MRRTPRLLLLAVLVVAGPGLSAANDEKRELAGAEPAPGAATPALDLLTGSAAAAGGAAGGARRTRAAAAAAWLRLMADYAKPSADGSNKPADDGEWFPRPVPISLPIGRGGASMPVLILPVPVPAETSSQCSAGTASSGSLSVTGHVHHQQHQAPPPLPYNSVRTPGQLAPQTPSTSGRVRVFETEEPAPPELDYIVSSQQLVELFQSQAAPSPELPPALIPDYTAGTAGEEEAYSDHEQHEHTAPSDGQRRRRNLRVRRYQVAGQFSDDPSAGYSVPYGAPTPPRLERSLTLRGELTVPRSGYTEPYTVWWDATTGGSRVDLHGGATSAYRMVLADGRVQGIEMRVDRSGDGEVKRCAVSAPRAPEPADRLVPAFPDMEDFTFAGYQDAEYGRVERWTRTVSGAPGELGGARGEALSFRHEVLVARAPDNYTATPLRYTVAVDSSVLGADCDGYLHRYTEIRDQRHEPDMLTLDTDLDTSTAKKYENKQHETEAQNMMHTQHTSPSITEDKDPTCTDLDTSTAKKYENKQHETEDQNMMHMQHTSPSIIADKEPTCIAEACEVIEPTTQRARVEPLREYTLPHRDPRYNEDYQQFKTQHRRQYRDSTEEAVRKTLMVQHSRFIDSGNRQGATFSMEVNHLGDRLDAELSLLAGVREEPEGLPAERFPHSRDQVNAMRASLPRNFDWRERGAVSHVRYQGSCSTCWAFAVAGAVEGALYVRTRRLVPLSEQCLVDCAHPYGGHGCGRTWPSAAYDYITERGIPSLAEYTPYQDKVLTCLDRRVPPVTHISGHVNVTSHSVQALKVAIRRHAPSVVIVDSTTKSFQFYKSGVLFDDRCSKTKPDHAVLAVGWGEKRREPHFILKNSWSDKWGDGGYIRVAAASNTCGVLTRPSYPRLERKDVDAAATAPTEPRTE